MESYVMVFSDRGIPLITRNLSKLELDMPTKGLLAAIFTSSSEQFLNVSQIVAEDSVILFEGFKSGLFIVMVFPKFHGIAEAAIKRLPRLIYDSIIFLLGLDYVNEVSNSIPAQYQLRVSRSRNYLERLVTVVLNFFLLLFCLDDD
jgi:hypothetical protein